MSDKNDPFEKYVQEYEDWFEKNQFAYLSELALIKSLIPKNGIGIELGVGTGRFSAPLNISLGIDPSLKMKEISNKKGIKVITASAEDIPLQDEAVDFVLMVTTICFLKDIDKTFSEVKRILNPSGNFILGFVDKNSKLGKQYKQQRTKSKFYKQAYFYAVEEVLEYLAKHNFNNFEIKQTLFSELEALSYTEMHELGYGKGGFVGIKAVKC